jgi:hypothetical protein
MADPRKLLKALLTSSTMHGRLDAEEKIFTVQGKSDGRKPA